MKQLKKVTFKGKTFNYFVDDTQINEGDWCIHTSHGINSLHKCLKIKDVYIHTESTSKGLITNFNKVIETNDPDIEL